MLKYVVLIFIFTQLSLSGQVCGGNLGDNIFTEGDFGSGADNILQEDPGIAAGYVYNRQTPPADGDYLITNNTGAWPGGYSTWLSITDNSDDPDGYMMVVNASFDPGEFYRDTVENLCGGTLYEFSADIINMIIPGTADHSDPNVSFLLDGEILYTTGNIPKTGEWEKYGFTYTTEPGQSTAILTLQNNAPGGIGNDLALDNIAFLPCGPSAEISVDTERTIRLCEDSEPITVSAILDTDGTGEFAIQWQRSIGNGPWLDVENQGDDFFIHDLFTAGRYRYRYLSASDRDNLLNERCRIISDLVTIEVVPRFIEVRGTTCEDVPFIFGESMLSEPGVYIDTFTSILNCDSIVTLTLDVLPAVPITAEIAESDPSCYGYMDGVLEIQTIDGGYGVFIVEINDVASDRFVQDLSAGIYSIKIIDQYGCNETFEIELENPEELTVTVPSDISILLGDQVDLFSEANYPIVSYNWMPEEIVDCINCPETFAFPFNDVDVFLEVESEMGCRFSTSFRVEVDRSRLVFIPSIFSPNEDGINDVFFISSHGASVEEIEVFNIYDRFGGIVHASQNIIPNDLSLGWDGKFSGNKVADGVYTFIVQLRYLDGSSEYITGDITVVR